MADKQERPFDIVVWGATGFTGELVAEYLSRQADVRWAIGGRSLAKLEAVRDRLCELDSSLEQLPLIVADSMDRASLDAMCAQTHVVASTVGPFARFGASLVAACVGNGTDYCDITGEPQFIRAMIDAHHDEAVEAGVRIVHCCGFDSIPSDLGTLCVQEALLEKTGQTSREVRGEVRRLKGGPSGGTIASIANILDEAKRDPEIRRIAGNPYSLNPPTKRSGPRVDQQMGLRSSPSGWTAPFLMAAINEKIVRRSDALLHPEADPLAYSEVSSFGHGLAGWNRALGAVSLFAGVGIGLGIKPIRNLLVSRALPAPGEGPTRAEIAAGSFVFVITGSVDGEQASCTVTGKTDPGYGETSKMLSESAMCLAFDRTHDSPSGVLTPASAMGMTLVDRLNAADLTFEVS